MPSTSSTPKLISPVVIAGLAIVLMAAGIVLYWNGKKATTVATVVTASPTAKATVTSSATTDPTSNWKTYTATTIHLSFKYPSGSTYTQKEEIPPPVKTAGHQIYFSDSSKAYPSFYATSTDFVASDTIPHDLIKGDLTSATSFTVNGFDMTKSLVKEVTPGVYLFSGYSTAECSPGTSSHLFIAAPKNSGLKYIDFYLGAGAAFTDADNGTEPCDIKAASITQRVNDLQNGKVTDVKASLDKALLITTTFKATELTATELQNETYPNDGIPHDSQTIILTKGAYTFKDPAYPLYDFTAVIDDKLTAFGDLNADGTKDAIVTITKTVGSGGGPQIFSVVNDHGKTVSHTSDLPALQDRDIINSITIKDGIATFDLTVHGPNDSLATPTVHEVDRYKLSGTQLVKA